MARNSALAQSGAKDGQDLDVQESRVTKSSGVTNDRLSIKKPPFH